MVEAGVKADPQRACAFVALAWAGRQVLIEHQWIAPSHAENPAAPLLVFLHEGLGSVALWRGFPQQLCNALGCRGLVYSRPGYGQSTARADGEHWPPDYMHAQAQIFLPTLLHALGVDPVRTGQPIALFGHSDGATIALLHAARFVGHVACAVVLAPHIFVEDCSLVSIAQARHAYLNGDLRQRLTRFHADPDSAFWGWNNAWLNPAFAAMNICAEVSTIRCPVLAVQGLDDEYGTLEQVRGIARLLPQTQLLEMPHCGHSPHRDQPDALLRAVTAFCHTTP